MEEYDNGEDPLFKSENNICFRATRDPYHRLAVCPGFRLIDDQWVA